MEIELKITGSRDELLPILRSLGTMGDEVILGTTEDFSPLPEVTADNQIEQPKEDMGTVPPFVKGGKKEKAPDDLTRHCHTCGHQFHPKFLSTMHCSKKCYMHEYWETYEKKTETIDPGKGASAKRTPEQDRVLKEKLEIIKKTYPAPVARPNISRDLTMQNAKIN